MDELIEYNAISNNGKIDKIMQHLAMRILPDATAKIIADIAVFVSFIENCKLGAGVPAAAEISAAEIETIYLADISRSMTGASGKLLPYHYFSTVAILQNSDISRLTNGKLRIILRDISNMKNMRMLVKLGFEIWDFAKINGTFYARWQRDKTGGARESADRPILGATMSPSEIAAATGPGDYQKDETAAAHLPDVITECSMIRHYEKKEDDPCIDATGTAAIGKIIGNTTAPPNEIVKIAKNITKCTTERCVLSKLESQLTSSVVKKQLKRNLKLPGPTDVTLLNNFDIDSTMEQWRYALPRFYHCNFSMVDWQDERDDLSRIDLAKLLKKGFRTFGCVINTDKYSGRGKHWMALFVDMRDVDRKDISESAPVQITVEFFNSAGNPPQSGFADWLNRAEDQLTTLLKPEVDAGRVKISILRICRHRHQESQTECGVYSLFYIWCRLRGVSYDYFKTVNVPDKWMLEMRQHLFYDENRKPMYGEMFQYDKYAGTTTVLWE